MLRLCFLGLIAVSAANRRTYGMGVGELATDIGSGAELLEQAWSLLGQAVTPGAFEALKTALNGVMPNLTAVGDQIETAHAHTQSEVVAAVNLTRSEATGALKAKSSANVADDAWFDCVGIEKADYEEAEAAKAAHSDAGVEVHAPCTLQKERAPVSTDPASLYDTKFKCEFGSDDCDNQFANYKAQFDIIIQGVKDELSEKRGSYAEAKSSCDTAMDHHANLKEKSEAATREYEHQRERCVGLKKSRKNALCSFGSALAKKCGAVRKYNSLVSSIESQGSPHSEGDRAEEWRRLEMVKCLVAAAGQGVKFGEHSLAGCEKKVTAREPINKLSDEALELAIACAEHRETFSGKEMEGPDYVVKEFAPVLEPPANFDFCYSLDA